MLHEGVYRANCSRSTSYFFAAVLRPYLAIVLSARVERRILTYLSPSGHHRRRSWRFTCCTLWLRVCEKVTVMAFALRRLPVRSQTRNFISGAAAATGARAGAGSADREVVKAVADAASASSATVRRTIFVSFVWVSEHSLRRSLPS